MSGSNTCTLFLIGCKSIPSGTAAYFVAYRILGKVAHSYLMGAETLVNSCSKGRLQIIKSKGQLSGSTETQITITEENRYHVKVLLVSCEHEYKRDAKKSAHRSNPRIQSSATAGPEYYYHGLLPLVVRAILKTQPEGLGSEELPPALHIYPFSLLAGIVHRNFCCMSHFSRDLWKSLERSPRGCRQISGFSLIDVSNFWKSPGLWPEKSSDFRVLS